MTDLLIEYDPRSTGLEFLDDRLYEHNCTQTGKDGGKLFAIYHYGPEGEILAGLHGWIWAQACEIRTLWVHPDLRGQGIGRRMMMLAEEEAQAGGCQVILLNTYSFQAPRFYPQLGYQEFARLEDFPPGHQMFFYQKRLDQEKKP